MRPASWNAESHAAEADAGHVKAGVAELYIIHTFDLRNANGREDAAAVPVRVRLRQTSFSRTGTLPRNALE